MTWPTSPCLSQIQRSSEGMVLAMVHNFYSWASEASVFASFTGTNKLCATSPEVQGIISNGVGWSRWQAFLKSCNCRKIRPVGGQGTNISNTHHLGDKVSRQSPQKWINVKGDGRLHLFHTTMGCFQDWRELGGTQASVHLLRSHHSMYTSLATASMSFCIGVCNTSIKGSSNVVAGMK